MNLMRTTRMDNLNEINRIDASKRRKANEPAQQTVIHKELPQKPSRVEVHTIEPTTTTKSSLTHPEQLAEASQSTFLAEGFEHNQQVKGTQVTIGESVRQTVTITVDSQVGKVAKTSMKDAHTIPKARYEEVMSLYQTAYQPNEHQERTSIFA